MKIRYAVLPMLVLCLTACGNKTPQCSDEKTLELVKGIFYDAMTGEQFKPNGDEGLLEQMKQGVKLTVKLIRTASTDDKTGKLVCNAELNVELPEASKKAMTNYLAMGSWLGVPVDRKLKIDGTTVSTDIEYTSQMTDDKKQQLVEMRGFRGAVELVTTIGNMGAFKPVTSALPSASPREIQTGSIDAEIAAAKAAPKRNVAGVTLQAFECGDTCQLKYVDANGNSQSAICTDTKGCQSWAEGPKGFMPLIGAKADLVIGKKYILEGGVTMDNVVGISLADVDPPSSSK